MGDMYRVNAQARIEACLDKARSAALKDEVISILMEKADEETLALVEDTIGSNDLGHEKYHVYTLVYDNGAVMSTRARSLDEAVELFELGVPVRHYIDL